MTHYEGNLEKVNSQCTNFLKDLVKIASANNEVNEDEKNIIENIKTYLSIDVKLFDEMSGWYSDLQKCMNHCIARANGNKIKEDLADSDCPYECLIEIYIVSNEPERTNMSFSSYKIIKSIS
jgi:hypothetical protein